MTNEQLTDKVRQFRQAEDSLSAEICGHIEGLANGLSYVKALAERTDAAILSLRHEFEKIKNERIVKEENKNATDQPISYDSKSKSAFCTNTAQNKNLQPDSGNFGQNQPEEELDLSCSPKQCCGNCEYFQYEDSEGQGWCVCPDWNKATECGALCSEWIHRPLRDGEAVLWKTYDGNECFKLGYYCKRLHQGHLVRDCRHGGNTHSALVVQPLDTFNPYTDKATANYDT